MTDITVKTETSSIYQFINYQIFYVAFMLMCGCEQTLRHYPLFRLSSKLRQSIRSLFEAVSALSYSQKQRVGISI